MVVIGAAEAAFVQYVSQNVNYTSTIILKRVIKSKVELSLAILILLFMPVLYNWIQSLMSKWTHKYDSASVRMPRPPPQYLLPEGPLV